MNRTEKQKMLAGELYRPDAELGADQAATKAWLARYNSALAQPVSERHALLAERLGLPKRDIRIMHGATSRRKTVEIAGMTLEALEERIG